MPARRSAMSGGSGEPGLGGRELMRSALTVRPSLIVPANSSSHLRWSTSRRWVRPARRLSARARVSSSRAARSAVAITERRSRRSILAIPASAASARSCHSAAFRTGASCSASARTGSDLIWGRLSCTALAFMRSMDRRAAGTPPRSTSRAKGLCSSGRAATAACRWTRLALRPEVLGRDAGAERLPFLERGFPSGRRSSLRRPSRPVSRPLVRSGPESRPSRDPRSARSVRRGLRPGPSGRPPSESPSLRRVPLSRRSRGSRSRRRSP